MTEAQVKISKYKIEFLDVDELFFPNICLTCGKNTENKIQKSIIGNFIGGKEKHKDYHLNLPLCIECVQKMKIKRDKEKQKAIFIFIIGLVTGFSLLYAYASIFIGIATITFCSVFSFFHYKNKTSSIIEFEKYLQLKSKSTSNAINGDVLQMTFLNDNYASYLGQVNLKHNSNLELVKKFEKKELAPVPTPYENIENKERKLPIECPHCKAFQGADVKFCTKCGNQMGLETEHKEKR